MKNTKEFLNYKKISLLVFCLGVFFCGFGNNNSDSLRFVVKERSSNKVRIIKGFDIQTNKLRTKEKIKNGKRVYFIEFNEKGKVKRHINKKGEEIIHVPGCNC